MHSVKPASSNVFTRVNLRVCVSNKSGPKNTHINSGYLFEAGVRVAYLELFLSSWILHTLTVNTDHCWNERKKRKCNNKENEAGLLGLREHLPRVCCSPGALSAPGSRSYKHCCYCCSNRSVQSSFFCADHPPHLEADRG